MSHKSEIHRTKILEINSVSVFHDKSGLLLAHELGLESRDVAYIRTAPWEQAEIVNIPFEVNGDKWFGNRALLQHRRIRTVIEVQ